MENKKKALLKKEAEKDETSPYQELYGKKQTSEAANEAQEKPLADAGAFGSAAKSPGPESHDVDREGTLDEQD